MRFAKSVRRNLPVSRHFTLFSMHPKKPMPLLLACAGGRVKQLTPLTLSVLAGSTDWDKAA